VLTASYDPATGRRFFLFYVGTLGPVSILTLFVGWTTLRAVLGLLARSLLALLVKIFRLTNFAGYSNEFLDWWQIIKS